VLLVHYNNLKSDLEGEMRRIAEFLDIAIDESLMPQMLEHCSIDYMRAAAKSNPMAEGQLKQTFKQGADTFFNKGTNGRWREVLSQPEIARCDEIMAQKLTPDCAHWVKTGEMPI
jgi:aryl sulfotransferase